MRSHCQVLDSANCPISGERFTPLAIEFTTIPLGHMPFLYAVILVIPSGGLESLTDGRTVQETKVVSHLERS